MDLDYSLETPEERTAKVAEIIPTLPASELTNFNLTKLSDYILSSINKQEKKEKKILTDNRLVTVNRREMSYEGLVGKLENGEDGIYNMIANDKNIIFQPKASITDKDIEEIPALKPIREAIRITEEKIKTARGYRSYLLHKQLIELRQDQYVIKSIYKQPLYCTNVIRNFAKLNLDEKIYESKDGKVLSTGIVNFFNPKHVSAILCNYSRLKEDSWTNFSSDSKWFLMDFENIVDRAIRDCHPYLFDLLVYKIDGRSNLEIQTLLAQKHGIKHSVEYISSLWRNKIPKLIAEQATKDWLEWHYTVEEYGKWKRCSRCGEIKLAHNLFFSKNKTSKDGFYSICKCCRNKKKGDS